MKNFFLFDLELTLGRIIKSKKEVVFLKIGEFSKKTGLSVTSLRYYDRLGVLKAKRDGKDRIYSPEELEKATVIIFLQEMNFGLKEIKELLDLDQKMEEHGEGNIPEEIVKRGEQILEEKNEELKGKLKGLQEALAYVEYLREKVKSLRRN